MALRNWLAEVADKVDVDAVAPKRPSALADAFIEEVDAAVTETALESIVDRSQGAYLRGQLRIEEVETIGRRIVDAARQLSKSQRRSAIPTPETHPHECLWAYELIERTAVECCYACGQNAPWIDAAGLTKCGVCHPPTKNAGWEVMHMLV
jgi:hypothetical protein